MPHTRATVDHVAPTLAADFDQLYEAIDARLVEQRELLHTVSPGSRSMIWTKIDRLLDRRARLQRLDVRMAAAQSQ